MAMQRTTAGRPGSTAGGDAPPARRRRRLASALATAVLVGLVTVVPSTVTTPAASGAAAVGQGFNLNRSDLRFILRQIRISERHTATRTAANPCGTLLGTDPDQIPNGNQQGAQLPWGLRTVDGTCNNLIAGQHEFGAADTVFPRLVPGRYRGDYARKRGTVTDPEPRRVSNLIVDQTEDNPAAVAAAGAATPDASGNLSIPNVAPDVGLSAPYNSLFTLFGQFFDHGLDLVTKGGGTVFMPLDSTDPLYRPGSPTNFMLLTRATNRPGPDGILADDPTTAVDETADNIQEHANTTTSVVDQNQTYTSHPAHQAFLREYTTSTSGAPVASGRLLGGADGEGLASWTDIKAQALDKLGVVLEDTDVSNVPMLATDPYGNLTLSADGRPQLVTESGLVSTEAEGTPLPDDVVRTGHAFLDDIAHHAAPTGDRNPADGPGPVEPLDPDTDAGTTDDHDPTTYDDEMLGAHFVAGDGRANENIGLTSVHHVFHSEHNRLVSEIDDLIATLETPENIAAWHSTAGPAGWDYGQRLFQAARFVTEMEYQHLVFEEFARKIQPMVNVFGEGGTGYRTTIDPAIRAEFAHSVYRFGHSMLTETVARTNADGSRNDVGLIDAFLNPPSFTDGGPAGELTPDQAAGAVVRGMTRQVGEEIDEFVVEALRNNLLGLPLDLATINLARGRDAGVPRLNEARRAFYDETANSALTPYESWADLRFSLRHAESLPNFIAAYGTHESVRTADGLAARRAAAEELLELAATPQLPLPETPEEVERNEQIQDAYDFVNGVGPYANDGGRTTTGVDDIDLWVGGLAEKPMVFGGMLGATFNYVFETQLEDLQDGDRFYYLSRTAGLNLLTQLEGNSFAELVMRNTDVTSLPADGFSRPDFVFEVDRLGTSGAVPDDPGTAWNESRLLTRMPDGTLRFGGGEHVVFNGTAGADRVWASEGDDTIRGNDGDDWMQGGDGNDHHVGGLGDDILVDLAGDDVLKGGDGDDALSSGQGFGGDLNQGGRGKDFVVGGNDITETFAGAGDDFVYAGEAEDTVFGDDGDDWIEDGKGPFSLLQGDNGAPFQDDPNEPGHDVLNGDGGEQDYDAEGGDDVMMAGPGIQRSEGMLGFDFVTHKDDPLPADSDMDFTGLLPPGVETNRDRFDLVESLSGWKFDDVLRGDDRTADDIGTDHELTAEGIARVAGLAGVLPPGTTSYDGGNILLGGTGSDLIEGRGGDDLVDGDAWLNARLSVRTNPADPSTEIGSADGMRKPYLAGSATTLQQAVFAGTVDPGDIVIVREILSTPASTDRDTAVFTGPRANYTITSSGGFLTVTDNVGTDGTDRLRNVELLRFSDQTIDAVTRPSAPVIGTASAGDRSATVRWTAGPANGAQPTTEHRVQVLRGGAVESTVSGLPGNATSTVVTGLLNDVAYTFRVVAVNPAGASDPSAESTPVTPDTAFPRLLSTTPVNNAVDVPVAADQLGRFTRAVTSPNWTNAVQLRNNATGALVGRVVTYDAASRTVTVNPNANLVPGASYTLTFLGTGANGIRDAAGVRLPTTVVNFTATSDTTPPVVTSSTPADGATNVSRTANLVVTTSERVVGVSATSVVLRNVATGATVPADLTVNAAGTRITINPTPTLAANTLHRLVLTGGATAIRDAFGNPLGATTIGFRTRP